MTVQVRFLGVSGFEISIVDGSRVIIDPFLSGDAALDLPPSPVSIEELVDADLVVVTHGATDHLGQAIELAKLGNATLCCGVDVRIHALQEGLPETRIAKMISGCSYIQKDVHIKALEARHISFFYSHGSYLSGQPLSYLVEMDDGTRLFHSGDTSLFSDLKLFGELYHPDIVLLCVGAAEEGKAPLPPEEAALAADWLNPRWVIPMHFRPGSPEPGQFAECLAKRRSDIEVIHLQPGQHVKLPGEVGAKPTT